MSGKIKVEVEMEDDLFSRYCLHASLSGVLTKQVLAHALSDWMVSVGEGHIESKMANMISEIDSLTDVHIRV